MLVELEVVEVILMNLLNSVFVQYDFLRGNAKPDLSFSPSLHLNVWLFRKAGADVSKVPRR
jgi:hypothetical protein